MTKRANAAVGSTYSLVFFFERMKNHFVSDYKMIVYMQIKILFSTYCVIQRVYLAKKR